MLKLKNTNNRFIYFLSIAVLLCIAIAYAIMGGYMPPIGDDLGFYYSYASQNDCWYALPRFMYRHWIWNNGRMADMLTPVGVYMMPLWLRALFYGAITSAFFLIVSKISLKHCKYFHLFQIIIYALIAFTFRWDAIWMEYCATYNYVWSATFALTALYIVLNHPTSSKGWIWWLTIPFCFIATAMHEACGAPLAVGFLIYIYSSGFYKKQNITGKLMVLAFISGGLFTLTSPASYSRVGSMLQPEPISEMLIFSAGYVLLLIIAIIILFFNNRIILKSLINSSWIIFTSAAIFSVCFMLISKYGGRTGWFAQTFALIAIFRIISDLKYTFKSKLTTAIATILSIIIISHYVAVMFWQIKVGTETRHVIELYRTSSDGVIYLDYINEPELPWYVLNKTHGVPDDDDSYYRYRMSKHYGNGNNLIILPEQARSINWRYFYGPIKLNGKIITDKPYPYHYEDKIVSMFPRTITTIDNIEYIETKFTIEDRTLYLYSPIDRDRGEK